MDLLYSDDLKTLLEKQEFPTVSIYMSTDKATRDVLGNPLRLKDLLRDVRKALEQSVRSTEAAEILAPADALVPDMDFWDHQSDGLALFMARDFFRYWRLPVNFENIQVVGERFHIKPLLPVFQAGGLFYLLAISQNKVRFLQCTPYGFGELEVQGLPKSLAEALYTDDIEKQQSFHTDTSPYPPAPPSFGRGGERQAIQYGMAIGKDIEKDRILRFFRIVDGALHPVLHDQTAPLVLAAVERELQLYQEANSYPHLLDRLVPGNADDKSLFELHKEAVGVLQPVFHQAERESIGLYHELALSSRASHTIDEVVRRALWGQVDRLLVAERVERWGRVNRDTGEVAVHEDQQLGDEDLLDVAAVETILHRGTVFSLQPADMPDKVDIGAIFRYTY